MRFIERTFRKWSPDPEGGLRGADLREGTSAERTSTGRPWRDGPQRNFGLTVFANVDLSDVIRLHDKLLLVLSEHSLKSPWVQTEVETAFERERRQDTSTVLFPIRLDKAVMNTTQARAADIRTRHICSFTGWNNHDSYQKAFDRLLRDLKAESKKRKAARGQGLLSNPYRFVELVLVLWFHSLTVKGPSDRFRMHRRFGCFRRRSHPKKKSLFRTAAYLHGELRGRVRKMVATPQDEDREGEQHSGDRKDYLSAAQTARSSKHARSCYRPTLRAGDGRRSGSA